MTGHSCAGRYAGLVGKTAEKEENKVEISRNEIFRYLGYGRKEADERTKKLVESCLKELERETSPKSLLKVWPLVLGDEYEIDGGCFQTVSRNLWKNLKDCSRIAVFAATLGVGADKLIQKYEKLEISRAVVLQAAATAMLEAFCDSACQELKEEYESRGLYLRPRFSPGYGDFPLENQKNLLDALEAGKRIGIKLTDSLLMTPVKSVTAVMGISKKPYRCEVKGCQACGKADCPYRR